MTGPAGCGSQGALRAFGRIYVPSVIEPFVTRCVGMCPSKRDRSSSRQPPQHRALARQSQLARKVVRGVQFSPDGTRLTYLKSKPEDKRVQELWQYDLTSKQHQKLVDSETLLGESSRRSCQMKKRLGASVAECGLWVLSSTFWNKQGTQLMFPLVRRPLHL